MSLLDRYGIKEVADVTFYELNEGKPGAPVLYLDTLKISTVEQTAEAAEVKGGKGNTSLMAWDYGKEITLNLEDALFSKRSLETIYGGKAAKATAPVIKHKYLIPDKGTPFFKKENGEWFFNTKQLSALGLKAHGDGLGEKINLTFDNMTDSDEIFVFSEHRDTYDSEFYEGLGCYVDFTNKFKVNLPDYYVEGVDGTTDYLDGLEIILTYDIITDHPSNYSKTVEIPIYPIKNRPLWNDTWTGAESEIAVKNVKLQNGIITFDSSLYLGDYQSLHSNFINYDTYIYMHPSEQIGTYPSFMALKFTEVGKEYEAKVSLIYEGEKYQLIFDTPVSLDAAKFGSSYDPKKEEIMLDGVQLFELETRAKDFSEEKSYQLDISANTFPGIYYVTADTYARDEKTGKDGLFQLVIPRVKVLSESNTITMEADGEPTVFNMSLKALKPKNDSMMKLLQYDAIGGKNLTFVLEEGTDQFIVPGVDANEYPTLVLISPPVNYTSMTEPDTDDIERHRIDFNGTLHAGTTISIIVF